MLNFNSLSLSRKIIVLCFLIVLFGAGIVVFGIYKTKLVSEQFTHVTDINLPNANALSGMLSNQKDIFVLTNNWEKNGKTDAIKEQINKLIADYEKSDKWYQDIPFVPGEDELYQPVSKSWKIFKEETEKKLSGKDSANLSTIYTEYNKNLSILISFQGEEGKKWSQKAVADAQTSYQIQMICLLILLVISMVFSVVFGQVLVKNIRKIVGELQDASSLVASAATEIASSSEILSQAATEQASSIQETSASLEEITKMISNNTDVSKHATELSSKSLTAVVEGKVVVDEMLKSIEQINFSNEKINMQIENTNKEIENIVKIINEIGSKTKVINDIVFQTKLLSFNASVEAARAGEQGKGFAVVAEEIGKLASISGNAALEITQMLDSSIKSVELIISKSKSEIGILVNDSKEKIKIGNNVGKQCATVFDGISKDVSEISRMIEDISIASTEQSQGVTEINKAIVQLDHVTHENAATSSQSSTAANSLSVQAEHLNLSVNDLVLTIEGNARKAA